MPKLDAPTLATHRTFAWQRLRNAFLEVLAEQGYAALSLASVARRAGIARNTIYNYAATKDALLLAVVREVAEPFVALLVADAAVIDEPRARIALIVRRQLAAFAPGTRGLPVLNTLVDVLPLSVSASLASVFAPITDLTVRSIEEGIEAGVFIPVANVRRTCDILGSTVGTARRWIIEGHDPDVVIAETSAQFLGALGAPIRAPRANGETNETKRRPARR